MPRAASDARRRSATTRGIAVLALSLPFVLPAAATPAAAATTAATTASARPGHRAPPRSTKSSTRRSAKHAARASEDAAAVAYGHRADVLAFAAQVAAERGLDRGWVEAQLASARDLPSVARLVMPAAAGSAKNYAAYGARFVEPARIAAGVAWWRAHAAALDEAQARWGVPPEIVVGIVGVETFYGRVTGHYRVLDALATLAFDFPSGRSDRSGFYRSELRAFLTWCALEGRDPSSVRGSYAGAIGWPQFMPSSLLRWAVDFDHDGRVDLDDGGPDVIGSVAHYLAAFGWQRGAPTHFAVLPPLDDTARAQLLAPDILPTFTPAQMLALGAELPDPARAWDGPLALVKLENGSAPPSYVAGTVNFYAITRYNWSSYYAMSVVDLGAAVRRERERTLSAAR